MMTLIGIFIGALMASGAGAFAADQIRYRRAQRRWLRDRGWRW